MAVPSEPAGPQIPFPIFCISSHVKRYMLFDVDVVTWLRREHHILGVLIGTLPQIPQQNVFQGMPLELMPEEARLLVESGLAFIVLDRERHVEGLQSSSQDRVQAYQQELTQKGLEAAKSMQSKRAETTERALKRLGPTRQSGPSGLPDAGTPAGMEEAPNASNSLFASETPQPLSDPNALKTDTKAWGITPATSYPPLLKPPILSEAELPAVNESSYAVFKHLHEQGYYLSPGLRFGCQFTAYPGDPLRYHSHFLAVGLDWDEKVDMMEIIGSGRLGTGVKKGFLLGGRGAVESNEDRDPTRTFCLEWAGM